MSFLLTQIVISLYFSKIWFIHIINGQFPYKNDKINDYLHELGPTDFNEVHSITSHMDPMNDTLFKTLL